MPAHTFYRRNLPHMQRDGCALFVTFRSARGFVLPDAARDLVVKHCLFDDGRRVAMHAFVVMPDHVHELFTPLDDPSGTSYALATIMSGVKGASAHSINRMLSRSGPVWQDESFDHILRSDEALLDRVQYILGNPVRKGLVERWQDYRWHWAHPDLIAELLLRQHQAG